jgi:hypothetical protein
MIPPEKRNPRSDSLAGPQGPHCRVDGDHWDETGKADRYRRRSGEGDTMSNDHRVHMLERDRRVLLLLLLIPTAGIMYGCSKRATQSHTDDRKASPASEHTSWSDVKSKTSSFTFVRIKYSGRGNPWWTDYPKADRQFSARFQEVTKIKTDLEGMVLQLTDPELKRYPFIYMAEGGGVRFSAEEVHSLRAYLVGGGFLMVDDFWGEAEWFDFYREIKRVFPEREPVELDIKHPIFHTVFDLKEKPQVPSISVALAGRNSGITWEREDAKEVHFRGLFDDKGRMMAIFCHNTDLADGWERLGENEYYDQEFALKRAYPMGIDIVFYALTH